MAKVDNAATADPNAANWFKVAEAGLVSNNPDYFASQVLNVSIGKRSNRRLCDPNGICSTGQLRSLQVQGSLRYPVR